METKFDVVIVGGGVIGSAVARELSRYKLSICVLEKELAGKTWAMGEDFTLADCAAAPGLIYAARLEPFGEGLAILTSYFVRLMRRPSVARAVDEARPYRTLFPGPELMDD